MSNRLVRIVLIGVTIALLAGIVGEGWASSSRGAAIGHYPLTTRGLWVDFEAPGNRSGWFTGQLLQQLTGRGTQQEVLRQLNAMRAMGVNTVLFEMRSANGTEGAPWPACTLSDWLGPRWPQPTPAELNGLTKLVQLAAQRGMKVMLILNYTHMEEEPRTGAERWLGSILRAVSGEPNLDLVAFGGDRRVVDAQPPFDGVPDSCGGQAEAPLWLGPDSIEGRYVQWAIGYAMSLGLPPQKLTAESIVGDYRTESQQGAGPAAQDRHLWRPVAVMRTIFERLGIPPSQRTYALSLYAHNKCALSDPGNGACPDVGQLTWAEETLRVNRERAGSESRLTLMEWGVDRAETAIPQTVEGLGVILQQLGIEGGAYWKWSDAPADQPMWAWPPAALVKVRGVPLHYQPVQRELADLYGFHLAAIPNGSFEEGTSDWTIHGTGTANPLTVDEHEAPPWRGRRALHLTATGSLSIRSKPIRVSKSTTYTTTANLRFRWRNERRPHAVITKRPQVYLTFHYLTCTGKPSTRTQSVTTRYFQEQATTGFATFPIRHTTPTDACFTEIEIGARRGTLSAPLTLDIDNLR